MPLGVNQPGCGIPARACEVGSEQTQPGAKIAHGQSEQEQPERGIHRKMAQVSVKKNRRKQSPPFPVRNTRGIHQASFLEISSRVRLNPKEYSNQQNPTQAGPVKQYAFGRKLLSPAPLAIFRMVLFENFDGRFMVFLCDG